MGRGKMEFEAALDRDYKVVDILIAGVNSVVLIAERNSDLTEVAIKVIRNSKPGIMSVPAVTEIQVLKSVDSSRVVKLLDVLMDSQYTYLVMEFVKGGDLFHQLKSKLKRGFREDDALQITEGILEALVGLHSQGIAHRDIKLENVMLEEGDISKVKLVDFGMARWRKDPTAGRYSTRICGTPQYLPPQIVARQPYVPEEADMWSLGVVLYALIAGRLPFSAPRGQDVGEAILTQEISFTGREWSGTSKSTRKLISSLLSKDPSRRPTAAHCLRVVRNIRSGDRQNHGLLDLAANFAIVKREFGPRSAAVRT